LLPPCEVDPDEAEPSPLEVLESSEPELELLPEPESVEVAVVPVLPLSAWRAETMATDSPVPPIPSTAVATAAADARRNQRRRAEWDSSNASVVTMPQASRRSPQPHSKRLSSDRQVLLRAL